MSNYSHLIEPVTLSSNDKRVMSFGRSYTMEIMQAAETVLDTLQVLQELTAQKPHEKFIQKQEHGKLKGRPR